MTALLETKGIWKRFGGLVANSDVSISVERGEIVGLNGPNGAGKSTLFNLIAGVYSPSQGSIIFDGEDITRLSAAERCERGIARTFQVVKSFETMTVIDNVIVGALFEPFGQPRKQLEHQRQRLVAIGLAAIHVAAEAQIVVHRQARKQPSVLRHIGDAARGDQMLRHAVDPRIIKGDGAGARTFGPGDRFQQRRLAGAVGARDADDLALLDLDRDCRDRDQALIGGGDFMH